MKTKILYIVTKGTWGGAQRYVYDLATSLPQTYDVTVACGSEGRLVEKLRSQNIRTVLLAHLRRDIFFLRELAALYHVFRLLRTERPDIVHLNSSKAGGIGALAARLAGVPRIIYTAHGWPFTEERPWIARKLITALSWFTLLLAHETIVLSDRDYELAKDWWGASALTHIPNGVRNGSGFDAVHARRILETEYHVPSSAILIGTIAELHPNKGLFDLITTLPMLPDDVHACIIGEGELRERLHEYVEQLGVKNRVSFLGFIPDAAALIAGFDAFVLPSIKEGMPFVILEAGSLEVPIIATRVGGIPDVIEDGVDGFLVPTHDCEQLAARINDTLRSKESALERARRLSQKINERFSFDTVTLPKTLALYTNTRN